VGKHLQIMGGPEASPQMSAAEEGEEWRKIECQCWKKEASERLLEESGGRSSLKGTLT
jgi:hypothetical protein